MATTGIPTFRIVNTENALPSLTVTAPIVRQAFTPVNFVLPAETTFAEIVDRVNGLVAFTLEANTGGGGSGNASANSSGGSGGIQFYNGSTFGASSNLIFTGTALVVANSTSSATLNAGTLTLNTATINSTSYTGTANNATYAFGKSEAQLSVNNTTNFNGQPSSYYTNASNLSTGTLPLARLDANVLLTTSTTGINASALSTGTVPIARLDANVILTTSTTGMNASALSTGTVPLGRLTSANTTANGVVDTTTQNFAGTKTFTGVLVANGGSKLVIQNGVDGTSSRGIFLWTESDSNWGFYLSQSGAGKSLANGSATVSLDNRSGWHVRSRSGSLTSEGFLWENQAEVALMSLTGDTGDLYLKGNAYVGNSTSQVVIHTGSTTGINASALSTGTVPLARLDANVILTTSTTGINASALSTGTVPLARLDANVILTTSTTGMNASALSTGTVPLARLDANVLLTTSTTGLNASALSTGTVPDGRITGAYTGVTSLALGANVVANVTTLFVGNSTANASHTATQFAVANSTNSATLTPISLTIGTTVVNTTAISANGILLTSLNASNLSVGTVPLARLDANVILTTSTTGINASALSTGTVPDARISGAYTAVTSLALGANVVANVTTLFVGNSTANASHTATQFVVANSTNSATLTPISLTIGTTVVNTIAIAGNGISITSLNASNLSVGTVPIARLDANVLLTTSTTGINASALSTGTVPDARISGAYTAITSLALGANVVANVTTLFVGNSIANASHTATQFSVANSTNSATLTPISLTIGTTVVNTTAISGNGISITSLNASNLSVGTVPIARLDANVILTTSTTGINASALSTGTVPLARLDANVILTTSTTGINASALSTGTVPIARLDANVLLTTSTTGINASALSTGTVPLDRLTAANLTSNGIVTTGTQTFEGNKTFDADVTITGNLTLIGQATNLNVNNVIVTDSLIQLAANNTTSDALDIGLYGNYNPDGGDHEHTGFFRDASDGVWKLFIGLQEAPNTTINTSGTGYTIGTLQTYLTSAILGTNSSALTITANSSYSATLTVNSVTAQTLTGNLTGTASNATNLNSQPGSYYTNASNLNTGTVPIARLDANVLLTTSTTGINASALSTGTVPLARLDANVLLTTSTTGINASALSTGTVPIARLDANVLLTTSTTGINASALSTGTIPDARISGAYTNITSASFGANVVANVTTLFVGNSTANASHTATQFSVANSTNSATLTPISLTIGTTVVNTTAIAGNGISLTSLNASNLSVGTVPIARLDANVLLTTSTTGINASALSTGTVPIARLDANVLLTTSTTGINASALSTGTVPIARLDANVILTTSTTGINASALSTGTVPFARLTSANSSANGVVDTNAQTFAGVKTFSANTLFNDRVGIGTTTPTLAKLQLLSTTASGASLHLRNSIGGEALPTYTNGDDGLLIRWSEGGNPYLRTGDFVAQATSNSSVGGSQFRFFTQPRSTGTPIERLRLTMDGNAGIGNTAPAHLLRVEGTTSINGAFTTDTTASFGGATNALSTLGVTGATTLSSTLNVTGVATFSANANFDSGTLFVDGVNNRVGVNNTAPTTALEVTGTVTATTFSGSGASLTSLNASALSTGTVPIARLDANVLLTTSTTGINASALSTGTVPDARISGAYTAITSLALGANVVANVTTLFVGNSTANASHTATQFSVANSTNSATLTPISLTIGTTVVNTSTTSLGGTLSVTGNATFDTSTLFVDATNDSVGIGTTATGTESSLYLGAKSADEGGQLTLQRGTGRTWAFMLDNYQDTLRILAGNNTISNASVFTISPTGNTTISGTLNLTGTLTLQSALTANGGNGSAGQVLTTNGSGVYWSTVSSGAGANTSGGTGGIQFYNGTTFGADANLTFATNTLTVNGGITATTFSGNGISITSLNASNLSVGTVPIARLDANVLLTTSTTGINASALSTGTVPDARISGAYTAITSLALGANVVANVTTLFVGNSTANASLTATQFSVANSTNSATLTPISLTIGTTVVNTTAISGNGISITSINASNLGSGTVPIARLDANVILTTSTTGINASALSTGTVPLARLTSANSSANGVVDTTTQTFAGNKTFSGTVNATSTLGVTGTLSALGQLAVTANANFDSGVLFVDSVNNRVGVNNSTPTEAFRVDGTTSISGNVAIGTTDTSSFALLVSGSFAATTKEFNIAHPTRPGKRLRYGVLESPYHGVRLTGRAELTGTEVEVPLPEYLGALCTDIGSQVQLTNHGHDKVLWVDRIDLARNCFVVRMRRRWWDRTTYAFYWAFTGIRQDVEPLDVEPE